MELAMTNGFTELSLGEMEQIDGGVDWEWTLKDSLLSMVVPGYSLIKCGKYLYDLGYENGYESTIEN